MRRCSVSAEEKAKVVALCAEGLTAGQIAKRLHISRCAVTGRLRRIGAKLKRANPASAHRKIDWTPEQDAQLRELRGKQGLRFAPLARMFGVSDHAVRDRVVKLGITAPERPPSRRGGRRSPPSKDRPQPRRFTGFVPSTELPPERDASGNLTTLLTVSQGQCRFIYGDGTEEHCCAHPIVGESSWCAFHYGQVFQVGALAQRRSVRREMRKAA
jgi:hypothetical protein